MNSKKILASLFIFSGLITTILLVKHTNFIASVMASDSDFIFYDATKADDPDTTDKVENALEGKDGNKPTVEYVLGNVLSLGIKIPSSFASKDLLVILQINNNKFYLTKDGDNLKLDTNTASLASNISGNYFLGNLKFSDPSYLDQTISLFVGDSANYSQLDIKVVEKLSTTN